MSIETMFFVYTIIPTLLSCLLVTIKGDSIRRIFKNIPLYAAKESVTLDGEEDSFSFKFNLELLKDNVKEYLNNSLKGLCKSYYISFTPYIIEDDGETKNYYIDTNNLVDNVQINFKCNYYLSFYIDDYIKFSVFTIGDPYE